MSPSGWRLPSSKPPTRGAGAGGAGLNELLQEAGRLKEAQLKNRLNRQAWERAPQFFKYTCGDYPEVLDIRKLPKALDRVAAANDLKEIGNLHFKRREWEDALLQYTKAISVFVWFQRGADRSIEEVPLIDATEELSRSERAHVRAFLTVVFVNCATVLIRERKFDDAVYACTRALSLDSRNAKAWFRRAQAYYATGTTSGLEFATKDIKHAAQCDPTDVNIGQHMASYRKELSRQNEKDKKTFGNMFNRGPPLYEPDYVSKSTARAAEASLASAIELNARMPPKQKSRKHRAGSPSRGWSPAAVSKAAELGLDLDDPRISELLARLAAEGGALPAGAGAEGAKDLGAAQTKVSGGGGAQTGWLARYGGAKLIAVPLYVLLAVHTAIRVASLFRPGWARELRAWWAGGGGGDEDMDY